MERDESQAAQTSGAGSASGGSAKLFLGGLSWETNEEKLRQHFEKYGEIVEVIVMRDRLTNKPRGFGFITFSDEQSASRACQDVHTLDGRTIDAKPSVPQGEQQRPRSKKIFVGGLAPDTTEDVFKTHFERYGPILEAQIMVDHTSGRSRGFGFITFEDEASVEKVFAAGSMHELSGKKVEVKNATPKGSGPMGRTGLGRGALLPGRGFAIAGRPYPEFAQPGYGMAPGYQLAPGYGMVPPYGYGVAPYAAFPGMVMGGYGYGYPPGYAAAPGYTPAAAVPAYGAQPQQPQQQPAMQPQQQPQQQLQQQRLLPAGRGVPGAYQSQPPQLMGPQQQQQQQQQQQPQQQQPLQEGATERQPRPGQLP